MAAAAAAQQQQGVDPALADQLAQLDLTEQELLSDPCMASCCLKDLRQQREAVVLKARLLAQDPTAERQRLRGAVIIAQGPDDPEPEQQHEEEEAQLSGIRARRLRQLKQAARAKAESAAQGHGTLSTVPESQLMVRTHPQQAAAAVEGSKPDCHQVAGRCCYPQDRLEGHDGVAVCHLAVQGYAVSAQLLQQRHCVAGAVCPVPTFFI